MIIKIADEEVMINPIIVEELESYLLSSELLPGDTTVTSSYNHSSFYTEINYYKVDNV